jgi:AcrR family transcriptional regulator
MEQDGTSTSLRERKKRETRLALGRAAVRLAIERGIDQVRVEDIAAAANVSPRTFNNYFASKEEAFVFLGAARTERIAAALRARPADEPLREALVHAVLAQYAGVSTADPEWAARLRLVFTVPALQGAYLRMLVANERLLAAAIAARRGTDPESDLPSRVLAAAVLAADRVAIVHWLSTGAAVPFSDLSRQAIASVIAGEPPASTFEGEPT